MKITNVILLICMFFLTSKEGLSFTEEVILKLSAQNSFELTLVQGELLSTSGQVSIEIDEEQIEPYLSKLEAEEVYPDRNGIYKTVGFHNPRLSIITKDVEGKSQTRLFPLSGIQVISLPDVITFFGVKVVGLRDSYRCSDESNCEFKGSKSKFAYVKQQTVSLKTRRQLISCDSDRVTVESFLDDSTKHFIAFKMPHEALKHLEVNSNYLQGNGPAADAPEAYQFSKGKVSQLAENAGGLYRDFLSDRTHEGILLQVNVKPHRLCEFVKYDYRGSASYRKNRQELSKSCQDTKKGGEDIFRDHPYEIHQSKNWLFRECVTIDQKLF